MNLIVNGEPATVTGTATVTELVARFAGERAPGVAVAVNDHVVPRTAWPDTALAEGDSVEILVAVQGG